MNQLQNQLQGISYELDRILQLAGELGRVNGGEVVIDEYIAFYVHFPLINTDNILRLLMRRFPDMAWNVTESTITARPRPTVHRLPFTAPAPKGDYPCLRM